MLAARLLAPRTQRVVARLGLGIYRKAVTFDDWVLKRISGAQWEHPYLDLELDKAIVVVANHRSWTDVLLLQSIIARRGPIVKFLCKRELAYIPMLGLIFIAFDFPMLQRRARGLQSESERRSDDRRRVREACTAVYRTPAAMLSFAEGTRFSEARHHSALSPYRHLLPPRPGGFAAILDALEPLAPKVVDVTLIYPHQANFWQFLSGEVGRIEVVAEQFPMKVVLDRGIAPWLEDRWAEKDLVLGRRHASRQSSD